MSVEAYEFTESPKSVTLGGETESLTLVYVVIGTEDEKVAIATAVDATSAIYSGRTTTLKRQPASASKQGNEFWYVDIPYETDAAGGQPEAPPKPYEYVITNQTGTGNVKITKAKALADEKSWDAAAPPDTNFAIGFDGKKVNGVDILTGSTKMSLKVTYPARVITQQQLAAWNSYAAEPHYNNDNFLGYEAGELLYVGNNATVTIDMARGDVTSDVAVTFDFLVSPNQKQPYTVAGITMETDRKGWDYVDVRYEKSEDGGALVPKALYVYVWRVYDSQSFGSLFGVR